MLGPHFLSSLGPSALWTTVNSFTLFTRISTTLLRFFEEVQKVPLVEVQKAIKNLRKRVKHCCYRAGGHFEKTLKSKRLLKMLRNQAFEFSWNDFRLFFFIKYYFYPVHFNPTLHIMITKVSLKSLSQQKSSYLGPLYYPFKNHTNLTFFLSSSSLSVSQLIRKFSWVGF